MSTLFVSRENPTAMALREETAVIVQGRGVPKENRAAPGLRFPNRVAKSMRLARWAVRYRDGHIPSTD